jgi:hypothetical protein
VTEEEERAYQVATNKLMVLYGELVRDVGGVRAADFLREFVKQYPPIAIIPAQNPDGRPRKPTERLDDIKGSEKKLRAAVRRQQ